MYQDSPIAYLNNSFTLSVLPSLATSTLEFNIQHYSLALLLLLIIVMIQYIYLIIYPFFLIFYRLIPFLFICITPIWHVEVTDHVIHPFYSYVIYG